MRFLGFIVALIVLTGCAGGATNNYQTFHTPPAKTSLEAELGAPVITAVTGYSRPAIRILEPVEFSKGGYQFELNPGLYEVGYRDNGSGRADVNGAISGLNAEVSYSYVRILLSGDGCKIQPQSIQVKSASSVPGESETHEGNEWISVTENNCVPDYAFNSLQQGGMKRELIYLGLSDNTIRLKYREYYDNLARAAFSNDLTYDISKDNVIGFRGARIRIENATNTKLSYQILDHMKE